jgi:E1A/CREB-binding protein
MLRRAREEGTVTHVTTLWDSFFEGGRDHRYDKPSVTHIPYLEGDYWPGEAENLLASIAELQRGAAQGASLSCLCAALAARCACVRALCAGGCLAAAGHGVLCAAPYLPATLPHTRATRRDTARAGGNTALSRKAGGSKGKRYGAGPATTDEALLARLGDILGGNMKEDFMVVHLHEPCSFCRRHVHGGTLHRCVARRARRAARGPRWCRTHQRLSRAPHPACAYLARRAPQVHPQRRRGQLRRAGAAAARAPL